MKKWLQVSGCGALIWYGLACCYQQIPSADLWWLLADGQWITQRGSIPQEEPFSWTFPGHPWHNDQWLTAWLFFSIHSLFGLSGLHLLKACLLSLSIGLALQPAARKLGKNNWPILGAALLLALSCSEARYFFDVRAYLFTYLFLVLLWRWLQHSQKLSYARVAGLFVLWSNLHGGVSSGLLLLGLSCLFATPDRRRRLGLCLGLALLASLVNPNGPWLLWHPLQLLGSPWGRYLNEWQPAWQNPGLFHFHFLHLVLFLLACGRGPRDRYDHILLVMGLFSLSGWRHIPLFALLALSRWPDKLAPLPGARSPVAGGLVLLTLLGLGGARPLHLLDPAQSMERSLFPYWGVRFLQANGLPQRLFHPYGLGGYLCWRAYPQYRVTIDGRAVQAYPWEAYRNYLRAAFKPERFEEFCQQNQVQLAMLFANPRAREAGVFLIEGRDDWQELYRDELVVIVGRGLDSAALVQPETPYRLVQQALQSNPPSLEKLQRALELDPDYPPARSLWTSRARAQPEGGRQ